ncbi:hypothetical protein CYMTET_33621 [Cymbomonas tetramitiformis]|uniref:Uncharacterized protein n=1 Tax=Cymbomonas tetramitiformis TaxID=36881 RepID=A0AAE0KR06_9CHLO|nr:hypothetical protein CYMTET_33621 [Cymbomonas tetramitiformis]
MIAPGATIQRDMEGDSVMRSSQLPVVLQDQLCAAIPMLLQEQRVCGVKKLRAWLREDKRAGIAAQAADSPEPELLRAAEMAGMAVVNSTLILPSTGDKNSDPFRGLIIRELKLQNALQKPDLLEKAREELKVEISNSVYNRVLKEFCVFRSNAWVLRTGNE